jgi:hypothetical protein
MAVDAAEVRWGEFSGALTQYIAPASGGRHIPRLTGRQRPSCGPYSCWYNSLEPNAKRRDMHILYSILLPADPRRPQENRIMPPSLLAILPSHDRFGASSSSFSRSL